MEYYDYFFEDFQSKDQKLSKDVLRFDNDAFDKYTLDSKLINNLKTLNWEYASPVQDKVIPYALAGQDLLVRAETGSGKTGAFLIPIIQRLLLYNVKFAHRSMNTKALIVVPTRELAIQIHGVFYKMVNHSDVNNCIALDSGLATGGTDILQNTSDIEKNPELIVCTPGRIVDLIKNSQFVDLSGVEILVIDEADRMFQLGFQTEIDTILSTVNSTHQTMLFSATLNKDIKDLARAKMNAPTYIDLLGLSIIPTRISQNYIFIDKKKATKFERIPYLYYYIDYLFSQETEVKMIIFCKTKKCCLLIRVALTYRYRDKLDLIELHGDMKQLKRNQSMTKFRNSPNCILVATDLASRGIDVEDIDYVTNFEAPNEKEKYVHRVGRTARANKLGTAITICDQKDKLILDKYESKKNVKKLKISDLAINQLEVYMTASKKIIKDRYSAEIISYEIEVAEDMAKKAENSMRMRKYDENRPEKRFIHKREDKLGKLHEKEDNDKTLDKNVYNRAKSLKKTTDLKRKRDVDYGGIGFDLDKISNKIKHSHKLNKVKTVFK